MLRSIRIDLRRRIRGHLNPVGGVHVQACMCPQPLGASAKENWRSLRQPAAESITNVQTAGVDEGGFVKHAGDFLVILLAA
jgi:uncharacterized secreted protein with C-terminal beta-propeller domain